MIVARSLTLAFAIVAPAPEVARQFIMPAAPSAPRNGRRQLSPADVNDHAIFECNQGQLIGNFLQKLKARRCNEPPRADTVP